MAKKKTKTPAKTSQPAQTDENKKLSKPVSFRGVDAGAFEIMAAIAADMKEKTGEAPTQGEIFNEMANRANGGGQRIGENERGVNLEAFKTVLGPYFKEDLGVLENVTELIENFKNSLQEVNNQVTESKNADMAIFMAEKENFEIQITELKNQLADVNKKAVFLKGAEFVCTLKEPLAIAARKARPFIYKDGLMQEVSPDKYPNELVNIAVDFFLVSKYESIVLK